MAHIQKNGHKKVVIVGMGLIGGSLAMALKKNGMHVYGLDSDGNVLEMARHKGIESYRFDAQGMADKMAMPHIFADTDIVILSLPVSGICEAAKIIADFLPEGAIITDTGSVKKAIVREIEAVLPDGVSFVGGHPMAGSENSGFEWAREDLFDGAPYVLTATAQTDAEALWAMTKLVKAIGAKPVVMSPEEHDKTAAAASHLPQLISTALVNAVSKKCKKNRLMELAGGGWRDTTRIAGSNAFMWKDVLIYNRDEILPLISSFKEQLLLLEAAIESSDGDTIIERFQNARAYKNRG
ncbi:MAG: prephenate dehydrogenase [Tepidanaerobacteraceae bacterium]|nr:prephenate dehydrogenase [Tepidanaerobacteraceae bacterium]